MTSLFLVCPFRETVITRFQGKTLVVRTEKPEEVADIPENVRRSGNRLHSVYLTAETPLSSIASFREWTGIPLSLHVPEMGDFLEFATKLHVVQGLDLRVFLSLGKQENYRSLRVLSSLGIPTAVVFDGNGRAVDWEALCDLMTYALLGKVPHAGMEPFQTLAVAYAPNRRTDLGAIYFEDPSRYLHVSEEGKVALTGRDLSAGRFVADSVSGIPDVARCPAYADHMDAWRESLLRIDDCARCEGWRICLGRFSPGEGDSPGCERFFAELLNLIEQYQLLQGTKDEPCRASF